MRGARNSLALLAALVAVLAAGAAHAAGDDAKCEAGDEMACTSRAILVDRAAENKEEATRLFKRGCELSMAKGTTSGCVIYVLRLQAGTKADRARALTIYNYLCDHDDATGCVFAAQAIKKSDPARAAQLDAKQKRLLEAMQAHTTAMMTESDRLTLASDRAERESIARKDPRFLQMQMFDRQCRAGNVSTCLMAVPLYLYTDVKGAAEVLIRYCSAPPVAICGESGIFAQSADKLARNGFVAQALQLDQIGCDAGQMGACYHLADTLQKGKWGQAKDVKRAQQLFTKLCDEDATSACAALLSMPLTKAEQARVLKQLEAISKGQTGKMQRDAANQLAVERAVEPFIAQIDALHEETVAQEKERAEPDRLSPAQFHEATPDATAEDLASAQAWTRRRPDRQARIRALIDELRAATP